MRRNDQERRLWVLNVEGLYRWWQGERIGLYVFIRRNRRELDKVIDQILAH